MSAVVLEPMVLGDPRVPEKIWAHVGPGPLGCWNWTGTLGRGYGRGYMNGRYVVVHRFVMEAYLGAPIDPELHVDHLCRNRACCNPDHLEVVTKRENILRGIGPTARNARKTHCPAGHPYDEKNTRKTKYGRYCRTCQNAYGGQKRPCPQCGAVVRRDGIADHRRSMHA